MGVNLGGCKIGVSQKFLHGPEVRPSGQKLGGKTVPQGVEPGAGSRQRGVAGVVFPNPLPGKPLSAPPDKKRRTLPPLGPLAGQKGPGLLQITLEPGGRLMS